MVNIFDFLRIRADLLILDANGDPLMLVKVKAWGPADELTRQTVVESIADARLLVPYVMMVDPETIQILEWDGDKLSKPLVRIPTADIFVPYDPDYESKKSIDVYLLGRTDSWLRDLAYNWKFEHPPGTNQLTAICLAQRLRGSTAFREPAEAA
jgi:hypothetical protein